MSMTGGAAIQLALNKIGRLFPGEVPSTSEYTTGLSLLNNLLDNLSLQRLDIPVIVIATQAVSAATATFGPAGTFTTRYIRLDTVGYTNSGAYFPAKIVPQRQYQSHYDKAASTSIAPEEFYYDYQFPVATGYLWPVPSGGDLQVGGWQALANFPDTTTTVNTPQGYDEPIVFLLARRLLSVYRVPAPKVQEVLADADAALASLRALNASNYGDPAQPPPAGPVNAIPPSAGPQQNQ